MKTLSDVYQTINSFEWRWQLARERAQRIAGAIARDQLSAAATMAQPSGSGRHARNRRLTFWADRVRALESA